MEVYVETKVPEDLVRVAVLEPDPLLRAGLGSVLRAAPEIDVVADLAAGGDDVAAAPPTARPDLLVVSGAWLREGLPALRGTAGRQHPWYGLPTVVVLDVEDWPALRHAVTTRSVRGFVDRTTSHEDLAPAVRDAGAGRTFLSSSVARSVVEWMATRMDHEPASLPPVEAVLTGREMEIFEVMGHGLTNNVIARRLGIQEATVRSHIYRILTKLNLRTRTEAALAAYKYAHRNTRSAG
jgi:DNA-binding NarL/FixJ family response regulator